MRVLAVASEVFPLIKTGGLADVVGALPRALAKQGIAVRTLVPGYPAVMAALSNAEAVHATPDLFGGAARVLAGQAAGLELFVLDAPHLFDRPGNPYVGPDGRDWPDNPFRFAALSRVAADIGLGGVPGWVPDTVHAHDWQTGLTAAYLHYAHGARPRTVMTVHNLAFTGQVPLGLCAALGLPPESLSVDGVEFYQSIGYLKAGLALSDAITTVSPTYAAEIQTQEGGCGFDGLLRHRRHVLRGILNGIDEAVWDPWTDQHLVARYRRGHLRNRPKNKAALQARMGLDAGPGLLFGVVSRLTDHKGMDLLVGALPALLDAGAQLALVGSGDRGLEAAFREAAAAHPGRIGVFIGYDEGLAHLLQAGADALLVPSRLEPCGLTQLCALRYGAVPVVSRAGGLADTIIDANAAAVAGGVATGIVFGPADAASLARGIEWTAEIWARPNDWRTIVRNGMTTDVGWDRSATAFAAVLRG